MPRSSAPILLLTTAAIAVGLVGRAEGQTSSDRIRTTRGTESGKVTDMTPRDVTLAKGSVGSQKIPVNEIRSIVFGGEPSELTQARVNARNGGYASAVDALRHIELSKVESEFIKQDVQFYQSLCAAKLALGGNGEIGEAGRALNRFVRTNPQNYHYLEAVEVMGDLLMASDKLEAAQKQYTELGKAPWPEYKMRAAVLVGRTLQAQGKHAEAVVEFDKVLHMPEDGADVRDQKLSATLSKAVSLAQTGGVDEAVGLIEGVIQDADPEQQELHARAYNALGQCYMDAGKTKDALLAYLHVDVLYNTVPEAHAEALAHLVPLWQEIGQEQRAREARQTLQDRYAGSRWAK